MPWSGASTISLIVPASATLVRAMFVRAAIALVLEPADGADGVHAERHGNGQRGRGGRRWLNGTAPEACPAGTPAAPQMATIVPASAPA
jgi:hypothetical protein